MNGVSLLFFNESLWSPKLLMRKSHYVTKGDLDISLREFATKMMQNMQIVGKRAMDSDVKIKQLQEPFSGRMAKTLAEI
jgi:hypothetical protein